MANRTDAGQNASVWLVADDYGLSPAVSAAIRRLIAGGRLSGTGCMTLFPEWEDEAARLRDCAGRDEVSVGLHLTLTDFAAMTGESRLAVNGQLPSLKSLLCRFTEWPRLTPLIHAELDAQLDAFARAMHHMPHYIDGHQHVHFLPPVRSWLKDRRILLSQPGPLPWLRGAPAISLGAGAAIKGKIAVVRLLAAGFDASMRRCGYRVEGPLAGFYDWARPENFAPAMQRLRGRVQEGAVVMCHPGEIDTLLKHRDGLVAARVGELETLQGPPIFPLRKRLA